MERKKLNIGLFGFGCVGHGLYEVLKKTPGLNAEIKYICVKQKNIERAIPESHFIYDKDIILNDPEINLVLELIDDAEAAFEIVASALMAGKPVVSANKKMIAENFNTLLELQRQYNVPLLYEASCCASIPIIRNLEEYYDNDLLQSLEGIVNGSTNFILSKTANENLDYGDALQIARDLGYVETDPTLDTGGFDAKYKLLILLAHAFGIVLKPSEIVNFGIDSLGSLELNYAREKNLRIKLIAQAVKDEQGNISALVIPKFIEPTDKLYYVDDVYNGIVLGSGFSEQQFFSGKGAGAHPTASAVLSDISALGYDYRYEYKKLQQPAPKFNTDFSLKIFLRFPLNYEFELRNYFSEIEHQYSNSQQGYFIGTLSLSELQKIRIIFPDISVVLFEIVVDDARRDVAPLRLLSSDSISV